MLQEGFISDATFACFQLVAPSTADKVIQINSQSFTHHTQSERVKTAGHISEVTRDKQIVKTRWIDGEMYL
jgi:hypothetical protein